MLWFFLSLAAALSVATSDALCKYALKEFDEKVVAWARWGLAAPFLLLLLPFIEIPHLGREFWLVAAAAVPLEIAAIIIYMKAIHISPLSLTIPFLALTPVFLIVTSFIFLGELPDISGSAGIFLIAAGAYLLNIDSPGSSVWDPFRSILREKGSLLMIVVAFIYSITSVLGKGAIIHSSPFFFALVYPVIVATFLSPFAFAGYRQNSEAVNGRPILFILIGLTNAVMIACHFWAVSLVEVAYMISIKRTSMVFAVFYGWFFFREVNLRERLLGSVVMAAGAALILI